MRAVQPSPTLLVFTLGPAGESARRSLLPEALKGMELGLRQTCLETALEAGRACGCRLEVCAPERPVLPEGTGWVPQAGAGFGERLEGAIAGAFARARRPGAPVLVVGTDVPGLAERHLRSALASLAEDARRVVLGPSPDGGFYLLAAARPLPPLSSVRWCRRDTLRQLRRALERAGRQVVLVEPLADLDRPADLEAWLARERQEGESWAILSTLLRRALADRRRPRLLPEPPEPPPPVAPRLTGRAPPLTRVH
jgi:2-phospho-L-lactate guanylyltransferase (CobY/MobA/RfbA family)